MEVTRQPMLRIAVAGLGSIGRRHARLLGVRAGVRVELLDTAAASIERALAECDNAALTVHASWEALVASRPDAIVIATPHGAHVAQTTAALAAGCHVLCEKPVSDTLDNVSALLAAARTSDRVLTYGFHLHFHPGLVRARQIVQEGRLGTLLYVHCHVGSFQTLLNSVSGYQSSLPGALMLDYVHQPDLVLWLCGHAPRAVFASGLNGGHRTPTSSPDLITMQLAFDHDFSATVHLNYLQQPEAHHYTLIGTAGHATVDYATGTLCWHADGQSHTEAFSIERDPVYVAEHDAFLAAIAGERAPESPLADALVSLAVKEAAVRSWQRRVPVALAVCESAQGQAECRYRP